MRQKFLSILLSVAVFITVSPSFTTAATSDTSDITLSPKPDTYQSYLDGFGESESWGPISRIEAETVPFSADSGLKTENIDGVDAAVLENSGDTLDITVEIEQEGFYHIGINYYALKANGSDIELTMLLDGESLFNSMNKITLSRLFSIPKEAFEKDNRGNELRPSQKEIYGWQFAPIQDSEGIAGEPYCFYFTEGAHTVSFTLSREKIAISSIEIYNEEEVAPYKAPADAQKVSVAPIIIEAEHPDTTSTTTLYPLSDMSDPDTTPSDPSLVRLNAIGGENWVYPTQSIEYSFDVAESGYYSIGLRYLQSWQSGMNTYRSIKIDGETPFAELKNLPFAYTVSWKRVVLGGDEPYYFYLTEGKHTLEIEVAIGEISDILCDIDNAVYMLNEMYREIIMITGTSPDIYRDYNLNVMIPDLMSDIELISKALKASEQAFYKKTGVKGGETATLQQIYYQLDDFLKSPNTIPSRLSTFETNISSLATWVMDMREQPLELDKIYLIGYGNEAPQDEYSFFESLWFSVKSFMLSFVTDYSSVGDVYEDDESITVWTSSGRDQAEILKEMIDSQFTVETDIGVNFSIVTSSLMQAVMAGRGPDVVCSVGRGEPINMALREAVIPLTEFEDFGEVADTYGEYDLLPYYLEGKCYALPVTRNFYMMFYRTDVFDELGIAPPNTWEELLVVAEVLQRNNMNIGLPYSNQDAYDVVSSGIGSSSIFPTLLMQSGVKFYNDSLTGTNLSTDVGYKTFKMWTEFYTLYGFDLIKNDFNRFRTGETPICISNYTFYNQLYAAAPEIRNMWEMTAIPGTVSEDGSINRLQVTSGTACVMIRDAENKEAAWEFMKWWTDAEVQGTYGMRIEALLGAAARYNPIKTKSVSMIPWSGSELDMLLSRFNDACEIEEIAGGYYSSRNLDNALKEVVYNNENPRETLNYWNEKIDEEIIRKRQEFNLD